MRTRLLTYLAAAAAAAAKPGVLPQAERRSLHRNFYWIKLRGGEDKLVHDAIHASSSGHYLLVSRPTSRWRTRRSSSASPTPSSARDAVSR